MLRGAGRGQAIFQRGNAPVARGEKLALRVLESYAGKLARDYGRVFRKWQTSLTALLSSTVLVA